MSDERITCARCGYKENPPGALACMRCHGSLAGPGQKGTTKADQRRDEIAAGQRPRRHWSDLGVIVAGIGLLQVLIAAGWVVWMMADLQEYRDLSAVQVSQLYTQGGLWVLVGIGILLAGILWVVSTRE